MTTTIMATLMAVSFIVLCIYTMDCFYKDKISKVLNAPSIDIDNHNAVILSKIKDDFYLILRQYNRVFHDDRYLDSARLSRLMYRLSNNISMKDTYGIKRVLREIPSADIKCTKEEEINAFIDLLALSKKYKNQIID